MRPSCLLSTIGLFVMAIASASAATRHVTTAAEFNALGTLNAGDVVVVHAGTYPDVNRTITGNGTADNPVTIYAEPLGSVAFSGPTYITLRGSYVTFAGFRFDSDTAVGGRLNNSAVLKLDGDSRNCRVTNCMFRNFNQDALPVGSTSRFQWLTVYGFSHTIEYCSFEGKQGPGVSLYFNTQSDATQGERRHLVRYNYFGERTGIGDNGYEAIQVGVGGAGGPSDVREASTFEYNYFFRAIYSPGAVVGEKEVISNKTSGNVYRRNTFRECSGELNLRAGSDCVVEENFFFGNGVTSSGGVGVMDRNHIVRNNYFQDLAGSGEAGGIVVYKATTDGENLPVVNAKIYHNTLVNCAQPLNLAYFFSNRDMPTDPVGTELRDNVVQSASSGGKVFTLSSSTAVFTYSGNHVYHPSANYGTTGLSGVTYGPSPNLTLDVTLGYYVPQAGSPILDVATTTTPSTDFDVRGLARPATKRDLGAFEREVSGTGARPLTRADVGPSFYNGPANTFAIGAATVAPVISVQPVSAVVAPGGSTQLSTAGSGATAYQWQRNGAAIDGATSSSLSLSGVTTPGLYTLAATGPGGTTTSLPAVVGVTSTARMEGSANEAGSNILHPVTGNTYDQFLLTGTSATVTADPGQVTRISYIDLNDDIVQVEFAGAGRVTVSLDNPSGPAEPVKYNQAISYMKGHATIIVSDANETTNLSLFSVGRGNAVNQALFKDVTYDSHADVAVVAISSVNGKFGGARTANASYFAAKGMTGFYAPGVQFQGPVFVSDINASDSASPVYILGSSPDVRVTGGDLFQANSRPVAVKGITQLKFTAGTNSRGELEAAQTNQARLEQDGVDVTSQIVTYPQ